jgi:hypothetical protein
MIQKINQWLIYNKYQNIIIKYLDDSNIIELLYTFITKNEININYDYYNSKNILIANYYFIIGFLHYMCSYSRQSLMIFYYFKALKLGNSDAMTLVAEYYQHTAKNYDLMNKYYLMAIKKNNKFAMHYYGSYFYGQEKYDLMKKYYLMACSHNNLDAIYAFGNYYQYKEYNYEEMHKYYYMLFKQNDVRGLSRLTDFYFFTSMMCNLAYFIWTRIKFDSSDELIAERVGLHYTRIPGALSITLPLLFILSLILILNFIHLVNLPKDNNLQVKIKLFFSLNLALLISLNSQIFTGIAVEMESHYKLVWYVVLGVFFCIPATFISNKLKNSKHNKYLHTINTFMLCIIIVFLGSQFEKIQLNRSERSILINNIKFIIFIRIWQIKIFVCYY